MAEVYSLFGKRSFNDSEFYDFLPLTECVLEGIERNNFSFKYDGKL